MTEEQILESSIKKTWDLFKKQYIALILGTIVAFLMCIFIITIPPMMFGIYYMCAQVAKGNKVKVTDVFKGFNYFFVSWGIALIALILIAIGLILLVIPGLILMVLFQYAAAVAILEKRGPIDALKRSYAIGKKHFSFSIVLWILVAAIGMLGSYTYVGVLLTAPFTALLITVASQNIAK